MPVNWPTASPGRARAGIARAWGGDAVRGPSRSTFLLAYAGARRRALANTLVEVLRALLARTARHRPLYGLLLSQEGRERRQALDVIGQDLEGGKEGDREEGACDPPE